MDIITLFYYLYIVLEIPWIKYSSTLDTCEVGKYLLKRRTLLNGNVVFEVWRNRSLEYNTSSYFEFLKKVEPIILKKDF